MSGTIVITNNSKKFKIDLTRTNTIQYRIDSNDLENTGDNFINIKFFLNTDYVYTPIDNILVVVSSYLNDQIVRLEEFMFKFEDLFFDKLINLNTDYVTIYINNTNLSLTGLNYAELHGNITQIKIPLVSRIYGSSNVPIKTDIYGRIDISGQNVDISGQRVDISGQRVDISGQRVDISGQRIDISGQRVDISGQRIDISGQRVDISGQRIDISGQRIDISGQRIDISGQRVDISGQRIDISGQRIDISGQRIDISGQRIDISGQRIDISGQRVDISGQRIDISGQRIDISGQRIDISGQRIDISGQRVDISGQRVDISGQRIDISGQRVDISGQRVDISGQRVDISGQRVDISGQRVDISGQRIDISGQRIDISGQSMYIVSVDISSNLVTQIKSTQDYNSNSGLNTYRIMPKMKTFTISGMGANSTANVLWTNSASTLGVTEYNWGRDVSGGIGKPMYVYSVGTLRNINYTYIDASGIERDSSYNPVALSTWYQITPSNIVGINKIWTSTNPTSSDNYYISPNTSSTAKSIAHVNGITDTYCGIYTCPNNARAFISSISVATSTTGEYLRIVHWTASGIRTIRNVIWCSTSLNNIFTGGSELGSLSGWIEAGESISVFGIGATTTNKIVYMIVNVYYY